MQPETFEHSRMSSCPTTPSRGDRLSFVHQLIKQGAHHSEYVAVGVDPGDQELFGFGGVGSF